MPSSPVLPTRALLALSVLSAIGLSGCDRKAPPSQAAATGEPDYQCALAFGALAGQAEAAKDPATFAKRKEQLAFTFGRLSSFNQNAAFSARFAQDLAARDPAVLAARMNRGPACETRIASLMASPPAKPGPTAAPKP